VGGIAHVGVIGVESVRIVWPRIGAGEALRAELLRKRILVHEFMKPQLAGNTNWLQVSAWQLTGLTMRRASRTLGLRAPSSEAVRAMNKGKSRRDAGGTRRRLRVMRSELE